MLTVQTHNASPETEIARAGNNGGIATENAPVPFIPGSRTMELLTDREVDRFIRFVIKRRRDMRDHERYLNRLVPRLAGGAATMQTQQGIQSNPATATQPPAIPFDQAAKRGIEPGPSFEVKPGAGTVNLGVQPLPAQGYLRMVELDFLTVKKGKKGAEEQGADYPWAGLETCRFQDTNGNQIDDIPGYVLFADNVFGGYAGTSDPRVDPNFSKATEATSFQLYLTRELAPNGFGAIANLSASQAYKLTLKIAPLTEKNNYKKEPEEAPTFLVTVWMHFWQLPEPMSLDGRPQVQTPPFHGTTQYRWWAPTSVAAGALNLKIEQTGNEIRNIVLIGREKEGIRTNAVFPEPFQLRWDTEFLLISGQRQLRKISRELVNDMQEQGIEGASTGYPKGVITIPFNFGEGRFAGGSGVNSWLPTVTGTRLQVTGTQEVSTAGEIGIFVNDVSVAETNPALRPVAHGPGGYTPQVAPRVPGAA